MKPVGFLSLTTSVGCLLAIHVYQKPHPLIGSNNSSRHTLRTVPTNTWSLIRGVNCMETLKSGNYSNNMDTQYILLAQTPHIKMDLLNGTIERWQIMFVVSLTAQTLTSNFGHMHSDIKYESLMPLLDQDKHNHQYRLLLTKKKTFEISVHLDVEYGYAHLLNVLLNFGTTLVRAYSLALSPKQQET